MIGIDEEAPAVTLATSDGQYYDLASPGQHLVLFFFEEAMSARSISMASDFNDQLFGFKQLGVQVIGIGVDRAALVATFASGYDLHYPLVSDADRKVLSRLRPGRHQEGTAAGGDLHDRPDGARQTDLQRGAAVRPREGRAGRGGAALGRLLRGERAGRRRRLPASPDDERGRDAQSG